MNIKTILLILLFFGYTINQTLYAQDTEKIEKKGQLIKPEVKFGGRIHYDFEFLNQKKDVEDYSFNGQEFRQVYITAIGTLTPHIKFKAELDFAGSKIGYRDMYIKFMDIPSIGGNLILGSQSEPTGMDMLASSNFIPFKERTPMTATQAFRWNSGFGYENFGLLKGKLGLQMTYGFNGKNTEGFTDGTLENGAHFVTRLFSPIFENKEKNKLVHFGMHYENRKYTKNPSDYTLKFRPNNHMGAQISVPFTLLRKQQDYGLEWAVQNGSFSFQSEYEWAGYHTEAKNYQVKGYYFLASYFLTGDNRTYKEGVFSRVNPFKNFDFKTNTWGAFEVLVRYSGLDYSDVIPGEYNRKVSSWDFGLNWYFNSNARIVYNYVITDLNQTGDNHPLNQHLFRVQVDF